MKRPRRLGLVGRAAMLGKQAIKQVVRTTKLRCARDGMNYDASWAYLLIKTEPDLTLRTRFSFTGSSPARRQLILHT